MIPFRTAWRLCIYRNKKKQTQCTKCTSYCLFLQLYKRTLTNPLQTSDFSTRSVGGLGL